MAKPAVKVSLFRSLPPSDEGLSNLFTVANSYYQRSWWNQIIFT